MANPTVPRTPAEFDYDLWTTEDGMCMVRVKRTGEVSVVDREVFRLLRSEEKRMRREIMGVSVPEHEQEHLPILSLNYITPTGKEGEWLEDNTDMEASVLLDMVHTDFVDAMTPLQREVYEECILGDMSTCEFAKRKSVRRQSVQKLIARIQEKAKKYFF